MQGCYHQNSLRNLPYKAEGLQPMKEMFLKKAENPVMMVTNVTSLKVTNPITTCVLSMFRKIPFYQILVDAAGKAIDLSDIADVHLESIRHNL